MQDELLQRVASRLVDVRRIVHVTVMKKLDAQLPPAQSELLMNIDNGPSRVKDIAATMHISSGAVTQLIDAMADMELVERFISEEDRRVVWVKLSEAGKRRLAKLRKQYHDYLGVLLEEFTEGELETFSLLMDKMVAQNTVNS